MAGIRDYKKYLAENYNKSEISLNDTNEICAYWEAKKTSFSLRRIAYNHIGFGALSRCRGLKSLTIPFVGGGGVPNAYGIVFRHLGYMTTGFWCATSRGSATLSTPRSSGSGSLGSLRSGTVSGFGG